MQKKYANLIPETKKLLVNGMGHDLPEKFLLQIITEILNRLFLY